MSIDAYEAANVGPTERLAFAACRTGVKRFIYLSSIKVNGDSTELDSAFRYDDPEIPGDPYSRSKLAAEKRLLEIAAQGALETVVIRPPLVYGRGVRANFQSLARLVRSGLPLPFASVNNRRSMIAVDNLADCIAKSLLSVHAAGATFLVSDDRDLSLPELIRLIADGLGKQARLFSLPSALLTALLRATAQGHVAERLLGSLRVDIEHTKVTLGWSPPIDPERAIKEAVEAMD